MPSARLSPLSPPADAIREAVQMELTLHPPKVNAMELGKLPDLKQWFRMDECATIFAVSNSQVRNWIDTGVLEARAIASALDPEDLPKRVCKRVTRESVVKLLNDKRRAV